MNPSYEAAGGDPPYGPERCTATARRTGKRCKRWPVAGARVCIVHGGKAPQVKRKADERVAEAEVRAALARYMPDCEPTADPLAALLKVAGEVVAFKTYVAARVAELDAADWRYNTAVAEQVRGEIQLYERALDRAAQVLGLICRLNLDERLVRLSERQGSLLLLAFERLMDALGLDDEQQERALAVAPAILREVGKSA